MDRKLTKIFYLKEQMEPGGGPEGDLQLVGKATKLFYEAAQKAAARRWK